MAAKPGWNSAALVAGKSVRASDARGAIRIAGVRTEFEEKDRTVNGTSASVGRVLIGF